MTAETLDTLRRDMTAAAASLADEKARSEAVFILADERRLQEGR